jgi:hypothetical protein
LLGFFAGLAAEAGKNRRGGGSFNDKIAAWLRHEITQEQLVTWAEEAIQEGGFPDAEAAELAQVVGRLGLADVKEFELA